MSRNKNRKFKTKNRRAFRNQKIRAQRCFRSGNKSKCVNILKGKKQLKNAMIYTFHWILGEQESTPLGNFINSINEKVNDLSDLLDETFATMQKEFGEKEQKIRNFYNPFRTELEKEYEKWFKKGIEEELLDEPTASQYANHFSGLGSMEDSESSEYQDLFERNSTSKELFFRSMLIMLYSLIESELSHEIKVKSLPVKFDYDSIGKLQFLQRILEENGIEDISYKDSLNELRIVRNSIVHNKSILSPKAKKEDKLVVPLLLKNTNCKLLKQGDIYELSICHIYFIKKYIHFINILFNQIQWAIDKGNEYALLKSRLLYLLKYTDIEVSIESISVNYKLKETTVNIEGTLPSHQNVKFRGVVLVSNNLSQRKNSLIMSSDDIFESLCKDGVDFLYDTTLKGFVSKELQQKVRLALSIIPN